MAIISKQYLLPNNQSFQFIFKKVYNIRLLSMGRKGKNKQEKQQKEEIGEKTQQKQEQAEEQQTQVLKEIIQPKKVQYCPVCTFPFQLCKYGKKWKECKKFLEQLAPAKVSKYHPQRSDQPAEEKQEEAIAPKKQKKQKSLKDKFIVITVKQRTKKKFVTTATGLQNFKIDAKELTKKLSKKFACSCSAVDSNQIQAQGDFEEDIRQMLKEDYGVKKKYILGKDQFKQKQADEKEKKKIAKKNQKNVIPEQPQEEEEKKDEQKEEQEKKPKFKTQFQAALADLSQDEEDEQQ